jgi:hypothetical protein
MLVSRPTRDEDPDPSESRRGSWSASGAGPLLYVCVLATVVFAMAMGGYQAWVAAVEIQDRVVLRFVIALAVGLLPVSMTWIAVSEAKRWRIWRLVPLLIAVLILGTDWWIVWRHLAAHAFGLPQLGASIFVFIHACGPIAVALWVTVRKAE